MNATTQAEIEVLEAAPASSQELATQTDTVTKALAEVSTSNLRLTELIEVARGLHAKSKDVAFDVLTVKGMNEAKSARLQLRQEARFPMQTLKEAGSKMLGQMQRQFNARADELIAEVAGYEKPIDEQIKAEEQRKEVEKAAREQAEREAFAKVQGQIDAMRTMVLSAVGLPSTALTSMIDGLALVEVTEQEFGARTVEAEQVKTLTAAKLTDMRTAALKVEAEWAELALQQEAVRVEQAAQVEREREASAVEAARMASERAALDAERAAMKADADKLAAERKALDDAKAAEARRVEEAAAVERRKVEDAARAAREAEEVIAAAARKVEQDRIDTEAAAERKRLDDEAIARRAEEQRIADEARAEQQRKDEERERQEAARQKVRNAAPAMFEVLEMIRDADEDCKRDGLPTLPTSVRASIDRVITAATA